MLSRLLKNNSKTLSYLFLLGVLFTVFYAVSYDPKLSPIGDNAHYIILGNSIADGSGYVDVHEPSGQLHKHYPPGYPLYIAAINLFSFDQLDHYKIANGLLLLGSIILCFILFSRVLKSKQMAAVTCILIAINVHLLIYGSLVMSEIPYAFSSLVALWFFRKIELKGSESGYLDIIILAVIVAICIYIRSIGVTLFMAFLVLLLIRKQLKQAGIFALSVVLLYAPWWIRNHQLSENSYTSQLLMKNPYQPELGNVGLVDLIGRACINLERYIFTELPAALLYTKDILYTNLSYNTTDYLIGIALAGVLIIGIFRIYKLMPVVVFYAIAYFLILLVWPSVWYGTRFVVPMVPILILFMVQGVYQYIQRLIRLLISNKTLKASAFVSILLMCWMILYGFGSLQHLNETSQREIPPNYINFYKIAEWTKTNLKSDDLIYTNKERIFHLHSNRKVLKIKKIAEQEQHLKYLIENHVDYVVLEQLGFSSTNRYLKPLIAHYPEKFSEAFKLKEPDTYLLKFKPELGYTGDWKNDKKEGYGIYVWDDGQKYEGYWKNNLRHGNGTVIFENGESLTGRWTNGSLNGIAVKKSADGKVIERALYKENHKVKVIDETQ